MSKISTRLKDFTTDQLQDEINRRKTVDKESARDKNPRQFYRHLGEFKTIKDMNNALKKCTESQQDTAVYQDNQLYILDKETPEELRTRLSRTGIHKWSYDQWLTTLFEDGEEVLSFGTSSEDDTYVVEWESRGRDNLNNVDSLGWNLEKAREYLGYSAKPIDEYHY